MDRKKNKGHQVRKKDPRQVTKHSREQLQRSQFKVDPKTFKRFFDSIKNPKPAYSTCSGEVAIPAQDVQETSIVLPPRNPPPPPVPPFVPPMSGDKSNPSKITKLLPVEIQGWFTGGAGIGNNQQRGIVRAAAGASRVSVQPGTTAIARSIAVNKELEQSGENASSLNLHSSKSSSSNCSRVDEHKAVPLVPGTSSSASRPVIKPGATSTARSIEVNKIPPSSNDKKVPKLLSIVEKESVSSYRSSDMSASRQSSSSNDSHAKNSSQKIDENHASSSQTEKIDGHSSHSNLDLKVEKRSTASRRSLNPEKSKISESREKNQTLPSFEENGTGKICAERKPKHISKEEQESVDTKSQAYHKLAMSRAHDMVQAFSRYSAQVPKSTEAVQPKASLKRKSERGSVESSSGSSQDGPTPPTRLPEQTSSANLSSESKKQKVEVSSSPQHPDSSVPCISQEMMDVQEKPALTADMTEVEPATNNIEGVSQNVPQNWMKDEQEHSEQSSQLCERPVVDGLPNNEEHTASSPQPDENEELLNTEIHSTIQVVQGPLVVPTKSASVVKLEDIIASHSSSSWLHQFAPVSAFRPYIGRANPTKPTEGNMKEWAEKHGLATVWAPQFF
ncbi:hypothetical protein CAEBREN_09674 [Caenorhabditis brenneri]|uniref:Uncharacterized protein n=1 Tax=Caenorhabditis brenneri TaxID=135651 RepID=G0M7K0_CAEBE|nr:hypothetical protein CAEBREN_09674 [Caenorhabditis brenneri]